MLHELRLSDLRQLEKALETRKAVLEGLTDKVSYKRWAIVAILPDGFNITDIDSTNKADIEHAERLLQYIRLLIREKIKR